MIFGDGGTYSTILKPANLGLINWHQITTMHSVTLDTFWGQTKVCSQFYIFAVIIQLSYTNICLASYLIYFAFILQVSEIA
jgi:hypothetical protein